MKFVHTFWSKPLYANKFNHFDLLTRCMLVLYAYSAECIHKLGESIVLVADKLGAEMLSFIPYDNVIIVDMENISPHFAASIKFKALELVEPDDVLIDGDLFLTKPEALLKIKESKAPVFCSFYEETKYLEQCWDTHWAQLLETMSTIEYLPEYKLPSTVDELGLYNTSLLRITDKELRAKYIEQYNLHYKLLLDIEFDGAQWPDFVLELVFLTQLANNVGCMLEDTSDKEKANRESLELGFTHLGTAKLVYYHYYLHELLSDNKNLAKQALSRASYYIKKYKHEQAYRTIQAGV